MRLFEKALRRSGLPVKMSEGFNPKPQFAYLLALGIGIESESEIITVRLSEWTRTREVAERLGGQLPDGIEIIDAAIASPDERPIARSVSYSVELPGGDAVQEARIEQLLASESVPVERLRKGKWKTVNIRPYIQRIAKEGSRLTMTFSVSADGTANPLEVLRSLGTDEEAARCTMRIVRTELN